MFDFARNVKLAITDTLRRTAVKAAGGAVIALGAGFLLAALWSFLATDLGWGSTLASLTVGGLFVVLGVVGILVAGGKKHKMPTTDDLRNEVQARVSLAADAAVDRARVEAARFVDMAEDRVHSLIDRAGDKAGQVVSGAERTAYGFARDTARKVGLTSENVEAAQDTARNIADRVHKAADTNAGSMAKVVGAFAVGVAIASKLQQWRQDDDLTDAEIAELYDDEYFESVV